MDPAALGTAIIGLDRIHRERDSDERGIARSVRHRRWPESARRHLANALRWTAERIAPVPTPA